MYVCVCICVYIHTHTHTNIFTNISLTNLDLLVWILTLFSFLISIYTNVFIHWVLSSFTHSCTRALTHLFVFPQVVAILKGHSKKVSCVVYHPTEDTVITASPDTQVNFILLFYFKPGLAFNRKKSIGFSNVFYFLITLQDFFSSFSGVSLR